MSKLDFLIGKNDIVDVDIKKEFLELQIQFSFAWEMDYGCFKVNQKSFLRVILYEDTLDKIVNDLKKEKGLVYKYIMSHREYVGELLDFRVETYE